MQAGTTTVVEISWVPSSVGTHTISVIVDEEDAITEADEDNNAALSEVIVGAYPDLWVSSLTFEVGGIPVDQAELNNKITLVAQLSNIGYSAATGVRIDFYWTDLSSVRTLIGYRIVDLDAGSTVSTSLDWTPLVLGELQIDAVINEAQGITEYDYSNNAKSVVLPVFFTPNASNGDWIIGDNDVVSRRTSESYQKNITIEDNGKLIWTASQLYMNQVSDTQPLIITIRGSGSLVLEGATIDSNHPLRIYLFDQARLFLNSSTLSASTILVMDGSSRIYMNGAIVRGSSSPQPPPWLSWMPTIPPSVRNGHTSVAPLKRSLPASLSTALRR